MRWWPFVHRARLEAEEKAHIRTQCWLEEFMGTVATLQLQLLSMKRDGFSPLPPKIAPVSSDPDARFAKAVDAAPNPELEKLVAEGYSRSEAAAILSEALDDFAKGGM